jgi:hypothetical protein
MYNLRGKRSSKTLVEQRPYCCVSYSTTRVSVLNKMLYKRGMLLLGVSS